MRRTTVLLAAALLVAPAHAVAQDVLTDTAEVSDTQHDEDDGEENSRLGLLGLLGLAGLLGLLRREPDIHVDARSDKRP